MLQTGFARLDITPPLGTTIAGYYTMRLADGVLDPLLATAIVFDDGNKRAIVMSLDLFGFNQVAADQARSAVAAAIGTDPSAVFLACTHMHLGPSISNIREECENPEYTQWLFRRLTDLALLAVADLAPTTMSYTRGRVENLVFVRRYRMKDGSVQTNPGENNPEIDHPLGVPDEESQLLILKREGKKEIGIVNFQLQPDTITGCKFSADFPHFVRETYEKMIDNSLCMYLNGAESDLNHIDVTQSTSSVGYDFARYVGKKIALSVIANYELAKPICGDTVSYGQRNLLVSYNKSKLSQIEEAARIDRVYREHGLEVAIPEHPNRMRRIEVAAEAEYIAQLTTLPDNQELHLTAIAIGDVVFAGTPGELFSESGILLKQSSKFPLTIPCCCTNGNEGHFPLRSAFSEGGYEVVSARFAPGSAEKLIDSLLALIRSL